MPNTRLFDRGFVEQHSADQGQTVADFDSAGVAELGVQSDDTVTDVSSILGQFKSTFELGRPGIATAISADLSAESKITVPTGKYWRVIGGFLQYTASADAATRTPIVTLEDGADSAYETFTLTTKIANDVENDHFLAGTTGNVEGTEGVAAQGTLTIAEQVTAGDTMTIDSVTYTFIAAGAAATVANSINLGATEAATKANIEAVLVDGSHPTVNAAAFSGDDMVLTARNKGTAGNSIVTTETFTAGTNVFDAGTLGTTTAGVDEADAIGTLDFPTAGVLLDGGDEIDLNVTNGHANDAAELAIFFIEFDNDPSA